LVGRAGGAGRQQRQRGPQRLPAGLGGAAVGVGPAEVVGDDAAGERVEPVGGVAHRPVDQGAPVGDRGGDGGHRPLTPPAVVPVPVCRGCRRTGRAAVSPLRTAPSIVSGQPVSVHAPARNSHGSRVADAGRSAPLPGLWRKVACRSRVTKKSRTRARRAAGNSRASSARYSRRSSAVGVSIRSSAADTGTARYWPPVRPPTAVRSNTHWTGEPTAAVNGSSMTGRS